jgi:hypothetical protein
MVAQFFCNRLKGETTLVSIDVSANLIKVNGGVNVIKVDVSANIIKTMILHDG